MPDPGAIAFLVPGPRNPIAQVQTTFTGLKNSSPKGSLGIFEPVATPPAAPGISGTKARASPRRRFANADGIEVAQSCPPSTFGQTNRISQATGLDGRSLLRFRPLAESQSEQRGATAISSTDRSQFQVEVPGIGVRGREAARQQTRQDFREPVQSQMKSARSLLGRHVTGLYPEADFGWDWGHSWRAPHVQLGRGLKMEARSSKMSQPFPTGNCGLSVTTPHPPHPKGGCGGDVESGSRAAGHITAVGMVRMLIIDPFPHLDEATGVPLLVEVFDGLERAGF